MKFPNDATGDALRRMQENKFNLNAEHEIEFFAVLPTDDAADTVAKQYLTDIKAGDKLTNIETQPGDDGQMDIIIAKKMLPTYENIAKFEKKLADRAAAVGGHDDGWGVLQK